MRDRGAPPSWVVWLEMAADWGCEPWELEDKAPAVWVDRWLALRVEQGKVMQKQRQQTAQSSVMGSANAKMRTLF